MSTKKSTPKQPQPIYTALAVVRKPGNQYSIRTLTMRGKQVMDSTETQPQQKLIALEEAKIAFVRQFDDPIRGIFKGDTLEVHN